MKNWIVISLIVFFAIVALAFLRIRSIYKRVEFDAWYESMELGPMTITDLLQGKGTVRVNFLVKVLNANDISLRIRDLQTHVYYQDELVGQSSSTALKNITIGPAKYQEWTEPIDIFLNKGNIGSALKEVKEGRDPIIDFKVSMRIYGIKYSYTDRIKLIQELT